MCLFMSIKRVEKKQNSYRYNSLDDASVSSPNQTTIFANVMRSSHNLGGHIFCTLVLHDNFPSTLTRKGLKEDTWMNAWLQNLNWGREAQHGIQEMQRHFPGQNVILHSSVHTKFLKGYNDFIKAEMIMVHLNPKQNAIRQACIFFNRLPPSESDLRKSGIIMETVGKIRNSTAYVT